MPTKSPLVFPLLIVLALTIFGSLYYYYQQVNPGTSPQKLYRTIINKFNTFIPSSDSAVFTQTSPLPSVSPVEAAASASPVPLPEGPQSYTFSHGDQVLGPKVKTITIDPLVPVESGKQNITLTATHDSPIHSVQIELITDNNKELFTLTQTSGTAVDGTWQSNWSINDTIDQTYGLRLILKSARNNYDNIMWIR